MYHKDCFLKQEDTSWFLKCLEAGHLFDEAVIHHVYYNYFIESCLCGWQNGWVISLETQGIKAIQLPLHLPVFKTLNSFVWDFYLKTRL